MAPPPPSLTPAQREERRRRAIEALARGLTQKQVAALLDTSVASVSQWKSRFHRGGADDLAARRQGRPPRLAGNTPIDRLATHLLAGPPDAQGLPYGVWDGAAVRLLIERETGIQVSRWTLLRYLDAWRVAPPALPSAPARWCAAPRSAATMVVLQSGQRAYPDPYWLLWARRPRGDWSVLAYPHAPTAAEREAFVARLLILWRGRLSLVAPPGDPLWTAVTLAQCGARWPSRLIPVPADPASTHAHQKTLVTPN
ncbi:helix-turn-helix domain-containing protein [Sphingomonas ginsenosidivorax]|uniref:Helix-turn-helix domain-containing protein n=1 Tax=Sphingomonas ginsenosidivorax TaxID=862135 RepID=A0A5C6UHE1_9SPHN|nr:helix-turn-helix domain-containing protein [Sphingomonas ginsenosidivorax]TXC71455.1 helix-turn-helix domain-containing protein [Sphingomonas ginsenosidivorax]